MEDCSIVCIGVKRWFTPVIGKKSGVNHFPVTVHQKAELLPENGNIIKKGLTKEREYYIFELELVETN